MQLIKTVLQQAGTVAKGSAAQNGDDPDVAGQLERQDCWKLLAVTRVQLIQAILVARSGDFRKYYRNRQYHNTK